MPLNRDGAGKRIALARCEHRESEGKRLVGTVIKFPDEGRIVRFGRADAQSESATVIILPVIRIERYDDAIAESAGPGRPPPAENGGRRRMRRR
jgi:hypothetical protein